MRYAMRVMGSAFVVGVLGLSAAGAAHAQGFGYGHHGRGGHGGYGSPQPAYGYYGNGGHDLEAHGHVRQTPFGSSTYFGQGRHDFRPHGHVVTPYGITGFRNGFFGSTQSYSPPAPYGYGW